jgi:hypothetical protein
LQATAAWESYHRAAVATQTMAAHEAAALARAMMAADAAATATISAQATRSVQEATRFAQDAAATTEAAQATAAFQASLATATAAAAQTTAIHEANVTTATAAAVATREVVAATATAQSVQSTATIQAMYLERERRLDPLRTYGPWFIGLGLMTLLIGLGSWALVTAMKAWDARQRVIAHGPYGRPLVLLDGPRGQRTILDPSRLFGPVITIDGETTTMPQLTSPELQNQTTARSQAVELRQAAHPPYPMILPPVSPRQLPAPTAAHPSLAELGEPELTLPTGIPWSCLRDWHGPGMAIGANAHDELIILNPARTPHLFVAGMSGSGKTRRLLRPLIAQALRDGYYVVLMNESGSDFSPFYQHPNACIARGSVQDYMTILDAALEEMARREEILRAAQTSEWRRLPDSYLARNPLMLLAIDELLALAATLSAAEQRAFWGRLAAFASRARKVGMGSIGLATDPTYRALGQGGLNYRSQCGRVVFRMMQAAGSRAILDEGGAEALAEGQFLALLDQPGLLRGAASNPGDQELATYLQSQPMTPIGDPGWLLRALPDNAAGQAVPPPIIRPELRVDGATSHNRPQPDTTAHNWLQPVATGHNQRQPGALAAQPVVQPAAAIPALPLDATRPPNSNERALIRQMHADGLSKNQICRELYGFKDGRTFGYVSSAIDP